MRVGMVAVLAMMAASSISMAAQSGLGKLDTSQPDGKTPEQIASELLANQAKYKAELAKHTPEDPAKK